MPCDGWCWTDWFALLWDGDAMERCCDLWLEYFGGCGVLVRLFVMAAELLLINFLTVAVTVFDLVILIDGVVRNDFSFVEFTINKAFAYNCTIREHGRLLWTGGVALAGAEHLGRGFCCHLLNSGRRHPLSALGIGT